MHCHSGSSFFSSLNYYSTFEFSNIKKAYPLPIYTIPLITSYTSPMVRDQWYRCGAVMGCSHAYHTKNSSDLRNLTGWHLVSASTWMGDCLGIAGALVQSALQLLLCSQCMSCICTVKCPYLLFNQGSREKLFFHLSQGTLVIINITEF